MRTLFDLAFRGQLPDLTLPALFAALYLKDESRTRECSNTLLNFSRSPSKDTNAGPKSAQCEQIELIPRRVSPWTVHSLDKDACG
jgi:hypothetical protein